MTKIDIQNPKLIVTNDYQQFLAHFEWFLALFQISDAKPELSPVELKVCKNGIFWTFIKNGLGVWVRILQKHFFCNVTFGGGVEHFMTQFKFVTIFDVSIS